MVMFLYFSHAFSVQMLHYKIYYVMRISDTDSSSHMCQPQGLSRLIPLHLWIACLDFARTLECKRYWSCAVEAETLDPIPLKESAAFPINMALWEANLQEAFSLMRQKGVHARLLVSNITTNHWDQTIDALIHSGSGPNLGICEVDFRIMRVYHQNMSFEFMLVRMTPTMVSRLGPVFDRDIYDIIFRALTLLIIYLPELAEHFYPLATLMNLDLNTLLQQGLRHRRESAGRGAHSVNDNAIDQHQLEPATYPVPPKYATYVITTTMPYSTAGYPELMHILGLRWEGYRLHAPNWHDGMGDALSLFQTLNAQEFLCDQFSWESVSYSAACDKTLDTKFWLCKGYSEQQRERGQYQLGRNLPYFHMCATDLVSALADFGKETTADFTPILDILARSFHLCRLALCPALLGKEVQTIMECNQSNPIPTWETAAQAWANLADLRSRDTDRIKNIKTVLLRRNAESLLRRQRVYMIGEAVLWHGEKPPRLCLW